MNYQYVYLSSGVNPLKTDYNGYYEICVKDLENADAVNLVHAPLQHICKPLQCLYAFHNSRTINKIIPLPFKKLWYPYYFKPQFDDRPICFVISNFKFSKEYYLYLKRKYPNAKFVKIHRDLQKFFPIWYPHLTKEFCDEYFDLSLTFDSGEARKYGMLYFDEFESKIKIERAPDYPLCDVFFAGKAKDRLPILMEVYNRLTSAGVKCNFYLTGVDAENRIPHEGIEYADAQMKYKDMLYRTVNARCILEINQEGANGYTSRFIEAVMYDKKLITNNSFIKSSKFYNPKNICCFDDVSEIPLDFAVEGTENVNFNYNGEFSPIHLIEQIDVALMELSENEV